MLRCKIQVFSPPEGYFRPMQQVSGIIKYTVYEAMTLKKMVISLKGNGLLYIDRKGRKYFRENYVDRDIILQEDSNGFILDVGTYEENFSFELPMKIPGSIDTVQNTLEHNVSCCIEYYVRIKFERGYWKSDKTFKKNIIVKPILIPRLPLEAVRYQKFKHVNAYSYTGSIGIVAAIENSVLFGRDKITLHYKLKNNSNANIFRILTNLEEVYTFKPNRPLIKVKVNTDVENTISSTARINAGDIVTDTVEIDIPDNLSTLERSALVTRQYYVKIVVQLPNPHSDMVLKIPLQIGEYQGLANIVGIDNAENLIDNAESPYPAYPPPSYWETMGEMSPAEDEEDAT